jgi:hypothetical protein
MHERYVMHHAGRRLRRAGVRPALTLIEAILLLTTMSVVAVGVAVGFQATADVPPQSDQSGAISIELASEMDYWRAVAWGGSPWPGSLPSTVNDTVTLGIGGRSVTCNRVTTIQRWDPSNIAGNSSPQSDFVRVQITINSQALTAYLTNPL